VRQCTDHVIIAGGEQIGTDTANQLLELEVDFIMISPLRVPYESKNGEKTPFITGDPQHEALLRAAGIKEARILIAASSDFSENFGVIKAANALHPGIPVVTRIGTVEEAAQLKKIKGLNLYDFVQPKFEAALEMVRQIFLQQGKPLTEVQSYMERIREDRYESLYQSLGTERISGGYQAISGMIRMMWVQIQPGSELAKKTIAENTIRSRTGASIVGVKHEQMALVSNPDPQYVLRENDMIAIIGTDDQCQALERLCGPVEQASGAKNAPEMPQVLV